MTLNNPIGRMLANVFYINQTSLLSLKNLPIYKYLTIEVSITQTASLAPLLRFNNDGGTNYSNRLSNDGAADSSTGSDTSISIGATDTAPQFITIFIVNLPNKEKLVITRVMRRGAAGVASAPERVERVAKWANTTSAINEIDILTSTSTFQSLQVTIWGSN